MREQPRLLRRIGRRRCCSPKPRRWPYATGQSLSEYIDRMRHLLLLFVRGRNHLIDARHQNPSSGLDESAHQVDKIGHGLMNSPSKDTRVQVAARAGDGDLEVSQSTKTVGEARCSVVQPVVVGLGILVSRGPSRMYPRRTMQTQSTPSKYPPGFDSLSTSSSRPSLPDSSIPSKQNLILTGRGSLFSW